MVLRYLLGAFRPGNVPKADVCRRGEGPAAALPLDDIAEDPFSRPSLEISREESWVPGFPLRQDLHSSTNAEPERTVALEGRCASSSSSGSRSGEAQPSGGNSGCSETGDIHTTIIAQPANDPMDTVDATVSVQLEDHEQEATPESPLLLPVSEDEQEGPVSVDFPCDDLPDNDFPEEACLLQSPVRAPAERYATLEKPKNEELAALQDVVNTDSLVKLHSKASGDTGDNGCETIGTGYLQSLSRSPKLAALIRSPANHCRGRYNLRPRHAPRRTSHETRALPPRTTPCRAVVRPRPQRQKRSGAPPAVLSLGKGAGGCQDTLKPPEAALHDRDCEHDVELGASASHAKCRKKEGFASPRDECSPVQHDHLLQPEPPRQEQAETPAHFPGLGKQELLQDGHLTFAIRWLLHPPGHVWVATPAEAVLLLAEQEGRDKHSSRDGSLQQKWDNDFITLLVLPITADAQAGQAADVGGHWSVLVVRRVGCQSASAELIDSLHSVPVGSVRTATRILARLGRGKWWTALPRRARLSELQVQRDSFQCGCFCLLTMQKILAAEGGPSFQGEVSAARAQDLRAQLCAAGGSLGLVGAGLKPGPA